MRMLPAYGVMWAAGRFAAARLHGSLPQIAVLFAAGSWVRNSSGGFYFLGGRFADPTLAGFLPRIARYLPATLLSALTWGAVAVCCHGAAHLAGARHKAGQR
jgi:hypothetical protein